MAQMCPNCSTNHADNASQCGACRQPLLNLLGQGTVLANRYRVTQVLGCGGMGAVYLAHDQNIPNQLVAVKENLSNSAQAQQQFQSEVQVMRRLRHTGLPRVTDQFTGPRNRQYMVMDYIAGETLEAAVQRRHPLPIAEIVDIGLQLTEVLRYLHSCQVIHRDIKPPNIRLTPEGQAVLVDFGISKLHVPGQRTQVWGKGMGTDGYAPLEQYTMSGSIGTDARTDLYSLGAVLYFALTNQTPPSALELERGVKPLTPPMRLRADVPQPLQRVIFTAMALPKDRRYQTADAMRQALGALTATPGGSASAGLASATPPTLAPTVRTFATPPVWPVSPVPATPSYSNAPGLSPVNAPPSPRTARRRTLAAALQFGCVLGILALLLVVVLGGGYAYFNDGRLPLLGTVWPLALPNLVSSSQNTPVATHSAAASTPLSTNQALLPATISQIAPLRHLGKGEIQQIAWSPNGQWLAVASSWAVYLYTLQANRLVEQTTLPLEQPGYSLAFSSQSEQLAVGLADGTLLIYRVADGVRQQTLRGHTGAILSVAFSPTDPTLLASGSQDTSVRLWQVDSGALLQTLTDHIGDVSALAFAPDGQQLASGERHKTLNPLKGFWGGTVQIWRVADGVRLMTIDTDMRRVNGLAFSPDGATLVTGEAWLTLNLWRGRLRLWQVATGRHLRDLGAFDASVDDVAFAANGETVAAALRNGTLALHNASDGAPASLQLSTPPSQQPIVSAAFSPNGALLAAGSADGALLLWQVDNGVLLQQLTDYTGAITSVAISSDGTLVWGESSTSFALGEARTALEARNGAVQVWGTHDGIQLHKLQATAADGDVEAVALSPDGTLLAAGGSWNLPRQDGAVRLWQMADGGLLRVFEGTQGIAKGVAFAPNGTLLAVAERWTTVQGQLDGAVRIWPVDHTTPLQTLEGFDAAAESLAFAPDGQWLAAGLSNGEIRLWQVAGWAPGLTLAQHDGSVNGLAFAPDSTLLASGAADGRIYLWRVADGAVMQTMDAASSPVNSVAFSPDGALLAAGCEDGLVRVWATADGQLLQELRGHRGPVNSVVFSADGMLLVSGSADKSVWIWGVP